MVLRLDPHLVRPLTQDSTCLQGTRFNPSACLDPNFMVCRATQFARRGDDPNDRLDSLVVNHTNWTQSAAGPHQLPDLDAGRAGLRVDTRQPWAMMVQAKVSKRLHPPSSYSPAPSIHSLKILVWFRACFQRFRYAATCVRLSDKPPRKSGPPLIPGACSYIPGKS